MKNIVRTIRDIALRAMGLIGFYLGASFIVGLFPNSGGANIGAALMLFVAIMGLSGLGGLYDGSRVGFLRVAVIWVPTAILVAVGTIALFDPLLPFDVDVFVSDLWDMGGFMAGLVAVPALLGGLLASTVSRSKR